ncbi:MAG: hypothetical protein ACI4F9_04305 [Lachnospiraceae bacterium]
MLNLLFKDDIDSDMAENLLICLTIHGGNDVFRTFLEFKKIPLIILAL